MTQPYSVIVEPDALRDLADIAEYIREVTGFPERGERFVTELYEHLAGFDLFPIRGAPASDLGPGLRLAGYRRKATIVFHVDEASRLVRIVAILYRGRDVFALMRRRLTS